jgi:shikimate kinase
VKNLVLVGFMGTGKTTVGKAAAERLGMEFVDTDCIVEAAAGRTIERVFAESGEAAFRELEAMAVAQAASRRGAVIATGGGALGRPENVAALRASGVLVCLTARPEVVLERVLAQGIDRPMLHGTDPLERIRDLLAARQAAYAQADAQIDTSDLTLDGALEAVMRVYHRLANMGSKMGTTIAGEEPKAVHAPCPRCGAPVVVRQVQGDHCQSCGAELNLFAPHEDDTAEDFLHVLTGEKHLLVLGDGTRIIAHL